MRLTKSQAADMATNLAKQFLNDNAGTKWTYEIETVRPDMINKELDGKTHMRWSVLVKCMSHGAVIDGPIVLLVNLATATVEQL